MTDPNPLQSAFIIGGLMVVMCGSVMLFADFMKRRRELGEVYEPRQREGRG